MAIKRLDPKATFDIVSVHDEAILFETDEEIKALEEKKESTRFDKYLKSFDIKELKFKENETPTIFRVRLLRVDEQARLNEKHYAYDVVNKKPIINTTQLFIDSFELGCLGVVENDAVNKLVADELELKVVIDIGAAVNLLGKLSPALKKN